MNKTFIFDYDDTLAFNMIDYYLANLRFLEWIIIQKIGPKSPNLDEILHLETEIDKTAVKTMGFSMQRFPTSMRETYKTICEQLKIPVEEQDLQTAYDIGMIAFDELSWEKRGLVKGAEETLNYLGEQKDELILLTKGDVEVQNRKLSATNCRRWFGEKMYIVPKKNKEIVLDVVGDRDKTNVFHVGNGIRSDVEPALEAGIGAIYVPFETWAYEKEHKGVPEHPRLITFDSIIEIKHQYERIR